MIYEMPTCQVMLQGTKPTHITLTHRGRTLYRWPIRVPPGDSNAQDFHSSLNLFIFL